MIFGIHGIVIGSFMAKGRRGSDLNGEGLYRAVSRDVELTVGRFLAVVGKVWTDDIEKVIGSRTLNPITLKKRSDVWSEPIIRGFHRLLI